jgi:predicted enzyme related to lactoylglutathione lyase
LDISHLHLHVRDRSRSVAFYRDWFGVATRNEGDTITFMTGDRDFLLALMDDPAPAPAPPWFHFGVRLACFADVRDLYLAMQAARVPIVKPLLELDTIVSFRCADPDGYAIELYCERR